MAAICSTGTWSACSPSGGDRRGGEGGAATKRKVGSLGLDPDVLLDLRSHLNGGRLITGPSYPSVPDAFAVGQNSRQPKERLEGESDRTPHVLACAYGSLAHVQR